MVTQSNILAWKIPCAEKSGGLQSWGHKESDMTEHTHNYLINAAKIGFLCKQKVVITQPTNCIYLVIYYFDAEMNK